MPSKALNGLVAGIAEVDSLLEADPTPPGEISPRPDVTRAVTRGAVVLLSSHFERYLYAVTEELVLEINDASIAAHRLEERLRLQHSRSRIEELAALEWTRRADDLKDFIESEGWLWSAAPQAELSARKLLTWMRAPSPKNVVRLFRLWGIPDIFVRVTRAEHTRRDLRLNLQALVDKRNNIAHGEFSVEATRTDVQRFRDAVSTFCDRADRAVASTVENRLGIVPTWSISS